MQPQIKNKVIALIPARGGSKGVPKKNIHELGGFPLIAYSIIACKLAKGIDRIIVSTDDDEIANIAYKYGAEIPFIRPSQFAQDKSTDKEVIQHALNWFESYDQDIPQYWVYIRPTTPLRDPNILMDAINLIQQRKEATGLISVHKIEETPGNMFGMQDGYLQGLCPFDPRPEYFTLPRQSFPPIYFGNGYIDIIKTQTLKDTQLCYGSRILGFLAEKTGEIDCEEDFKELEFYLTKQNWVIYQYLYKNFPHD